jgi:hypothetical protein
MGYERVVNCSGGFGAFIYLNRPEQEIDLKQRQSALPMASRIPAPIYFWFAPIQLQ